MSASTRWSDLGPRFGVGALIAAVGLICLWLGGLAFLALTVLISGVIVWELVRMLDPEAPAVALACASGVALLIADLLPTGYALPLVLAPIFVGIGQLKRHRATFSIFTLMIVLAGFGMYSIREEYGPTWMLWMALVVIATDVMGYFAGRFLGGPKMWPRISPKKTWSGTIAGWLGAVVVAIVFLQITDANGQLIGLAVALSMASQLGDIAESAIKRRAQVKDSSSLLPGHGGLFDRFDGMLGASVFLLMTAAIIDFPPGTVTGF
ncbi:phosphatidate cytidylyltransferase [Maribius pontilimi]|uniref:Phosphatidate cytidylyltransferase n=1 Tax=Palleronia pontilimi TaxID=1964209 RepID=A0A934IJ48_9RHOB|nr:phosphatidate cytidylyltransferase [Palleronia pontilimi]MBJ3762884.1 phosphatidate cytidylyltransferase [Palleronia pontilimi]